MKFCTVMVFLFMSISLVKAQMPKIERADEQINLNEYLFYFENQAEPLTYQEALGKLGKGEFQKNNSSEPLNFGYDPSDYWFYTEFYADDDLEKVLYMPYPYHQYLNLHIYQNGQWQRIQSGNLAKFSTRGSLKPENFAWPVTINAGDTVRILVNVRSRSPIIMSVEVHSVPHYVNKSNTRNLMYGIFYGILFIMFLYNLFLYIILRDRAFLYYILLVLTNIAVFATVTGYAFKYLHPAQPEINFYIRELLISFLIIPTSLFAIAFLDLKRNSKIFYRILLVMIALGVFICLSIALGYTFGFSSLIISIHAPLLLITGIVVRFKGNKTATFYILAWTGYLLGGTAMTLRNRGILPANFITDHGAEIGAVLDVILLALALAYRYRQMRNERSKLQRENIQLIEQQNIGLEQKVRERTKMLNSTLDIVQRQFNDLSNKNLEMTSSINYALKIQEAIFPKRERLLANFKDVMLFYRPKETVSGDFFFFEKSGPFLFVAVVDCTGHGVPGALLSMAGYNLLYDAINVEKLVSPREILEYLDKNLRLRLNQGDDIIKDGMEAALCVINKESGEAKFCGAQRPLLIIQDGKERRMIKGGKRAIVGHIHLEGEHFHEHTFSTNHNTAIYLYSDGFQDQFGGREDKKYLSKRMVELLQNISSKPGDEQERLLCDEFEAWKGEGEQVDDVVILGVKL